MVMLVAVGVNAWLLVAVAAEFASGNLSVGENAVWSPQLSGASEKVPTAKPIDAYREILARPIFFKSREPFVPVPPPPPPVVVAMPPPVVADPGLVLGGVMIKNGMKKAYVFSRANTSGAWANEGDEFLGWQIRSINGAGAKLEQDRRSIELNLYPRE
jgi:hypothetical protein